MQVSKWGNSFAVRLPASVVEALQLEEGDNRLTPWAKRLDELEALEDPVDRMLAEIEANVNGSEPHRYDPGQLELFERGRQDDSLHSIRLGDGHQFRGTWVEIVRQMRDHAGFSHETVAQYMRRLAERWHEQSGVEIPSFDPRAFLRAAILGGLIHLDE